MNQQAGKQRVAWQTLCSAISGGGLRHLTGWHHLLGSDVHGNANGFTAIGKSIGTRIIFSLHAVCFKFASGIPGPHCVCTGFVQVAAHRNRGSNRARAAPGRDRFAPGLHPV